MPCKLCAVQEVHNKLVRVQDVSYYPMFLNIALGNWLNR